MRLDPGDPMTTDGVTLEATTSHAEPALIHDPRCQKQTEEGRAGRGAAHQGVWRLLLTVAMDSWSSGRKLHRLHQVRIRVQVTATGHVDNLDGQRCTARVEKVEPGLDAGFDPVIESRRT